MGLITSPGPSRLIVPAVPSIGVGAYPNVLTPAFVVPSSILLHALSLRHCGSAVARRCRGWVEIRGGTTHERPRKSG